MTDYFRQGLSLFNADNYSEALKLFQQATEEDPENHKAWNAAGICYSKLGDIKKAESCFEKALMIDPNNATYQKNHDSLQSPSGPESRPGPVSEPAKPPDKKPSMSAGEIIFKVIAAIILIYLFGAFVMPMIFGSISASPESWYSSRDLLIRDLERCAQYEETFRLEYESGNIQGAGSVVSGWSNVVKTQRASLLVLLVPSDKANLKNMVEKQLKYEEELVKAANLLITGTIPYEKYLEGSDLILNARNQLIKTLSKS